MGNSFQQHFTDAFDINRAMASLLGSVEGKTVLEPSVGTGSLLKNTIGTPELIDAVDIDHRMLDIAESNLDELPVRLHHKDYIDYTIEQAKNANAADLRFDYDAVIANPPYGIKYSPEYRRKLKRVLPEFYVRESYGLFLYYSIMRLVEGGRYVFLLPDTFLTSRNHTSLRRFLVKNASPDALVRFSSKQFETVNFGYGNLCIISGRKTKMASSHKMKWIEVFDVGESITDRIAGSVFEEYDASSLLSHVEDGWHQQMNSWSDHYSSWTKLGVLADCRTGIYTGDNPQYIGFDPSRATRRLNGHAINWKTDVAVNRLSKFEREEGLKGTEKYVQLVRGGYREFNCDTPWAIRWDPRALDHYRTDKKARFQNSSFYFRRGIAVPMVSARGLSGSLMDNSVFDQGIVGVFPHDDNDLEAILVYLNSSLATNIRNTMLNGGANNSANYVKRLPVPKFTSDDKRAAKQIISQALAGDELSGTTCDSFVGRFTN